MVVQFPAKPWMVWKPSVLRSMTQQLPAVWMNLNAYQETPEMMATCVRLIQFVRSNARMLKNNALKVMMVTIVKKKMRALQYQRTIRTNTV
jgi:phage gp37-like protein